MVEQNFLKYNFSSWEMEFELRSKYNFSLVFYQPNSIDQNIRNIRKLENQT